VKRGLLWRGTSEKACVMEKSLEGCTVWLGEIPGRSYNEEMASMTARKLFLAKIQSRSGLKACILKEEKLEIN